LPWTNVIDGAAVFEKETTTLSILFYAEAVIIRIEVSGGKVVDRYMAGRGNRLYLRPGDIDGSVFPHAAIAALLTAEAKAMIEKIGPVLEFSKGDDRHVGIIAGLRSTFNCKLPFTEPKRLLLWSKLDDPDRQETR
jgi:hypothetical protein